MTLYEPVHARLDRFVKSMVWDREEAKDIISETILVAFENFGKIRQKEAFLYYLFGIASRLTRNYRRRKGLYGFLSLDKAEQLPNRHNESEVMLWELNTALDKLPLKQRETIVLFEVSGLSIKEIVNIQGGTESGVKSRLLRGREALAVFLEKEEVRGAKMKLI